MANIKSQIDPEEAKKKLTPEQYNVCFLKGTEPPGTGKYNQFYEEGMYKCVVCGEVLFSSAKKFDAGSGWPSFNDAEEGKIAFEEDYSHGMHRTEAKCANCGSHLGHMWYYDTSNGGEKYFCVNSLSLEFVPKEEMKKNSKD